MDKTFAEAIKEELDDAKTLTENGATVYATSGSELVDLNFATASLRQKSVKEIEDMFTRAYGENPEYAVRWLFYLRDVRGAGQGERRSFRVCFKKLAELDAEPVRNLVPAVAEYGRFDDLYCLFGTPCEGAVIDYFDKTITADRAAMLVGKPCSLLAKWLKSPNTSSSESRAIAKKIYTAFGITEKAYRKLLSALRKHIDVVETRMSAKDWTGIDYQKVPSSANLRYAKAFLRNDETRRREYLGSLDKGEVKINAAACFPSDIVYRYMSDNANASVYENMWKALPSADFKKPCICVADTSGSMTWVKCDPKSGARPYDVACSLAIYCSEHIPEPFKDKCITFESRPHYIDFSNCRTLGNKIRLYQSTEFGGSTNIEAVMKLILDTAVKNGAKQEDIPNVCILSDMEFDTCVECNASPTLFDAIRAKYNAAGYELPRIFFWNLASRTNGIPLKQSPNGVGLVSGFSQNTIKMLLSEKNSPWDILKDMLDSERYARITVIAKGGQNS